MAKLLVLDDEHGVRESFIDFFEDHNYEVFDVENAEDAIAFLKETQVDGVLVDIRLPGMDGGTFINEVYKLYPATFFVVITGSPEYHLSAELANANNVCKDVFAKPVEDLGLLEKVVKELVLKLSKLGTH